MASMERSWLAVLPEPSLTCAVKNHVPRAIAVPEMIPVAGSRLNPEGRLPEVTDQVSGAAPPRARSAWL
jgi:hypothetical protein